MIGFESFSVSAWFENGITRHVAVKKPRKASRILASTLLSTALAVTTFVPSVASATSIDIASTTMTSVKPSPAPEVPVGYWPALINEMKSWEVAAEPDIEYPD